MKMNLKTNIIAMTILSFAFSAQSQITSNFDPKRLQDINVYNNINTRYGSINLDNVDGSPYLKDEFVKGKVIDTKKNQSFDAFLRYNIYKGQIQIKENISSDNVKSLERFNQYKYVIDGEVFQLFNSSSVFKGGSDNGYMAILSEEGKEALLLKNYHQLYTPPKKATSTYDTDKPAKLETKFDYYISKDGGRSFIKIEAHKRRILDSFFGEKQDMVKDYIKENNFKFRGSDKEVENQLRRVIAYYNSI
ncbi:hypothetical protein [Psychroflexus salarius]|nr:hypothetical protein [Psychroflexus salarius]